MSMLSILMEKRPSSNSKVLFVNEMKWNAFKLEIASDQSPIVKYYL